MATATTTVTYDDPLTGGSDNSQHSVWMYGTIAVQAAPGQYATGGLAISWVVGDFPKVSNIVPKDVYFYSAATTGTTVGGFGYTWNKASNKLQLLAATGGAAGTATTQEFANATNIPAAVSGDTIRFEARFLKAVSGF